MAARLPPAVLRVVEGQTFLDRIRESCMSVQVARIVCNEETVRRGGVEGVLQLLKLFGLILLLQEVGLGRRQSVVRAESSQGVGWPRNLRANTS